MLNSVIRLIEIVLAWWAGRQMLKAEQQKSDLELVNAAREIKPYVDSISDDDAKRLLCEQYKRK